MFILIYFDTRICFYLYLIFQLIRSEGPDELMPWRGVRRPFTVFKMLLLRHFSTDFDSDCFIRQGQVGDLKLLHRIVKFIIYGNLCKFMRNHKKCFFSFISRPILIVIALFGRAELRTLTHPRTGFIFRRIKSLFHHSNWQHIFLISFNGTSKRGVMHYK